jgi:biotin carboxyl carrier protein
MAKGSSSWFISNAAAPGAAPQAVTVEPLGAGRFAVTAFGKRREVDALILPHGAVSLLLEGASHTVELEEKGDKVAVLIGAQVTALEVLDARRMRLRAAGAGFVAEGKQVIESPMPGKVVKVFVKVGDAVTAGQGLVVVEAMKMENELKAPRAGKVVEVSAVEGATVENGARLLVVE